MAKLFEIYKCELCGNITKIYHEAGGTLSCCGAEMVLQVENTTDAAVEKHVPVITKIEGGFEVKVGETLHPMTEAHYIEWIELIVDDCWVTTAFLKPGDEPKVTFKACSGKKVEAKAYCNLHGYWKATL
ncbi:desulfoferrodoxin [Psychrilyobacter atlanticus]|uniref:desulfoferrodoxin n=1 Tax=Psychrilyobacter atlanticus TaxID=271091 RepID=UPI000407CD73|nr:desulfoferrodoxin [Psychrilyobacter atlanticus]